jgi:hypothetical protein
MSQAKAYVCVVLMQHQNTHEYRLLTDIAIAPSEEEALIKATLLAHPPDGGPDNWVALSREVQEMDRETLERAAAEVLGWGRPEGAAGGAG